MAPDRLNQFSLLENAVKEDRRVQYGDMLQNFYSIRANEVNERRRRRFESIASKEDALREVEMAGERIKRAFGKFPEDCPLNAKTTGFIEQDGVEIEKVLIQTRENIHATLLVYRRKGDTGCQPGILLVCGHSDTGKAAPHYQKLAWSLGKMGMTAVVIDPLGQGERKLYPGLKFQSVREHNLAGKLLSLAGEFFGSYRAYDARRAVDYMLTRSDIDASKLGVAGVSGGGTLSSYIFALDRRIAAAAPSCYITTFKRNFDNELPTDSEQIPAGLWADGGDMADFVISRAPAPALILTVENDYFDPRGTKESLLEAKKIYSLLGKEENVDMFTGPGSHDLPAELRDATSRFFAHHFLGADENCDVPQGEALPVEDILVLGGRMTYELENEDTISAHIAKKMDQLAAERAKNPTDIGSFLRETLQIPQEIEVPQYRSLRQYNNEYKLSSFAVKSAYPAEAILMRLDPDCCMFHLDRQENAVLYVGHLDTRSEMLKLSVPAGTAFYGVDVRGIGRSRSLTCDCEPDFFHMYDSDYFYDATGRLLNAPLAGGRVLDLLATVKLLKESCSRLTVCGCGLGGLIAAYAMAVDSRGVDKLVISGVPESWRSFINGGDVRWPQSIMIPGSLACFDLPELYEYIKRKLPTEIGNFQNQMMEG